MTQPTQPTPPFPPPGPWGPKAQPAGGVNTTARRPSPAELRMLALLADGHGHQHIATQLNTTRTAVSTALCRLYARMGARSAAHAVAIAIRSGLIPTTEVKS